MRFRIPEVFLGCLLAVAVFAAGMLFKGVEQATYPAQSTSQQKTSPQNRESKGPDTDLSGATWLTKDAAGFFTAALTVVGIGQAVLFFFQLRFMRLGMRDATIAARAATRGAIAAVAQAKVARDSAIKLQRPYIFIFDVEEFRSDWSRFYVDYTIANYGAIPAIIEEAFIGFVTSPNGEIEFPLRVGDDSALVTNPILKAGESRTKLSEPVPDEMDTGGVIVVVSPRGEPIKERIAPVWDAPDGHDVFFRIVVRYRGPFSAGHETSATWLCQGPNLLRRIEECNYNR